MNLYLVLAIALGAITGVAPAPAVRPVQLVSERRARPERRILSRSARVLGPRSSVLGFQNPWTEERGPRMRGEATPRAPASV